MKILKGRDLPQERSSMLNNYLYLQLFAEEAGAPAAESGDAGTAAENASGDGMAAGTEAEQTAPATGDEAEESWDSLIKGKYKQDYSKAVNAAINKRVRNLRGQIDAMTPAINVIAQKYGIQRDSNGNIDFNALNQAIENDDSLYKDEAFQRGVPVEELKQMKALERENAQLRANVQEDRNAQMWSDVQQQAQALKQNYPQFDLDAEMSNPEFGRMLVTLQNAGFGDALRTVYETIHRDELTADAMRYAVQRTNQKISSSIQSGMRRPSENGTGAQAASTQTVDLSHLTKAQIDDYVRRARNGEHITFT